MLALRGPPLLNCLITIADAGLNSRNGLDYHLLLSFTISSINNVFSFILVLFDIKNGVRENYNFSFNL